MLVHVGVLISFCPMLVFQNFGADGLSGLEIQGGSQREGNAGYSYTSYLDIRGI